MMTLPETVRLRLPDGRVQVLALEEYLRAVVPQEMAASWPLEALKAQAVAARCYAVRAVESPRHGTPGALLGADLCTEEHCQAYRPAKRHAATDEAVRATTGVVATHEGKVIAAYFSARCGGRTRASEDVWVQALGYCRSVACGCQGLRYGHGVGMCQHGARAMALAGHSYEAILRHYYTGVQVGRIGAVELPPVAEPLPTLETLDKMAEAARWHAEQATRELEEGDVGAALSRLVGEITPRLYTLEKGILP